MNKNVGGFGPTATGMIRLDHTHVMWTFHRYKRDLSESTKLGLVNTVCLALEVHAKLEEEIFYPAVRAVTMDNPAHPPIDDETIRKSVPEHDEMRRLIAQLRGMQPSDAAYDETFFELMRYVIHHVADEETVLLPEAEKFFPRSRLVELGQQMLKRRMQLTVPKATDIAVNLARGMPLASAVVGVGAVILMMGLLRGRKYAQRAGQ